MTKRTSTADKNPRFPTEIKSGATRAERRDIGRTARDKAPLKDLASLSLPKSRKDVISVLEESNRGRVSELIPVRYARMLPSPFTFFRGSAAIQAMDLSHSHTSGFIVQACGDCHIQNFGTFATPERRLVCDINDFDETLPAPWEWDVKRLAASMVLAAQTNGFSVDVGQEAARRMAKEYREHMDELSTMTIMEVWYSRVNAKKIFDVASEETRQRQEKLFKEATTKSSPEILMDKLTVTTSGRLRFREMPPLLCHVDGQGAGEAEMQAFKAYRDTLSDDRKALLDKFELVDMARKVVGIGSVGTICGVLLLVSSEQDVLILQVKEARKSVLEPYVAPSKYKNQGQRVVNGQKLMQAASDMFLGWTTGARATERDFYIRQLRDVKIGTNTALWSKNDFKVFSPVAGEILARAHARSGDASVLRGYLGKTEAFDEAIANYAVAYARQVERDYGQFQKACKSGKLKVAEID